MKENKNKTIGKYIPKTLLLTVAFVAMLALFAASPVLAANNSSWDQDLDTAEGTVLAGAVFGFFAISGLLFWVFPQRKEKKMVPALVAVAAAICVTAIVFYLFSWLSGLNIAFWTEYITYTGNEGAIWTSVAGSFLIMLLGGYGAYVETNDRKERNIVGIMFIALIVWNVLTLVPLSSLAI